MESKENKLEILKKMWSIFEDDYWDEYGDELSKNYAWDGFVNNKNLGIKMNKFYTDFVVLDERKWFLARIRYGI